MSYNSCRTCLTKHMRSMSCHIMPWPLGINSLRRGHTHAHIPTIRTGSILRNQVRAGLWLTHTWFKKFYPNIYICTKTPYRCCKIMLNICSMYNPYLQCNDRVMKYSIKQQNKHKQMYLNRYCMVRELKSQLNITRNI